MTDTLRRNLVRIRAGKHLSRTELADRCERSGRRLPEISIRRIEAGTRQVDVDDLMLLGTALGVCPVDLLIPGGWGDDAAYQITPAVRVPAPRARGWIGGRALLHPPGGAAGLAEVIRWMPLERAREVARSWSGR